MDIRLPLFNGHGHIVPRKLPVIAKTMPAQDEGACRSVGRSARTTIRRGCFEVLRPKSTRLAMAMADKAESPRRRWSATARDAHIGTSGHDDYCPAVSFLLLLKASRPNQALHDNQAGGAHPAP